MCWEFFDKIYCISLDERSDRLEEAKAQFKAVGLLERVEFVIINKHPFDCEQGIYESHVLCMKKGLHANAANMVIFEDDICFDRFAPETLRNAYEKVSQGKKCPHWQKNALFLLTVSGLGTCNHLCLKH